MYSILPTLVAAVFLGLGAYVLIARGMNRVTLSFGLVCLCSALWQGSWAVLFQVSDPILAKGLVRFGYAFILFLPTTLYHFLTEISERVSERRWVFMSYGLAGVLLIPLLASDLIIAGAQAHHWGYYPRAGALHPLHLLQTSVVVLRGVWITYRAQHTANKMQRPTLQLCVAATLTYFLAAIDYLDNYGADLYPPGVMFLMVSLAIITTAIVKHKLFVNLTIVSVSMPSGPMSDASVATMVAHELRTPLMTVHALARGLDRHLPTLIDAYQKAVAAGLVQDTIKTRALDTLSTLGEAITREVRRSNFTLDMLAASVNQDLITQESFASHRVATCIGEALERYHFEAGQRDKIHVNIENDFEFFGSDTLLVQVLFNLMRNAFHAISSAGKGEMYITAINASTCNFLVFTDTGSGMSKEILARIFDERFTTKCSQNDPMHGGQGIGLTFSQRVMSSFGGRIVCESVPDEFTSFVLEFPTARVAPATSAPQEKQPTTHEASASEASLAGTSDDSSS